MTLMMEEAEAWQRGLENAHSWLPRLAGWKDGFIVTSSPLISLCMIDIYASLSTFDGVAENMLQKE